ncbi:Flavin-containing monooxygenase ustF2 [Hyphodiscus hymeniophilus]|uniref:Flavin-containing monooxygenase ustF2 n=1 Tax=Hyphodiscus hymeniophilus TaxID=353542 RepID=A0A9P7AXK9_9HELO|nr:Flavin-containing monooxygenase ustF2 [Hyphodiscus hymeniophilus]
MTYKAKRVAVIGAGVSGVTSAKHLKAAGVEVVVYERSSTSGGNWSYDERQPLDAKYPSILASEAELIPGQSISGKQQDSVSGQKSNFEDIDIQHAPPGGLTNNVSTVLQELKGYPWPAGTEDFVNVRAKGAYLQGYSKEFGVESLIRYNTRVEKLEKVDKKWKLRSLTLLKNSNATWEKRETVEEFDAVVVANGHYSACKVPDIPGLKEWKAAWPERIQHSKRYRRPDGFKNQKILLVGAGVSSNDIARETVDIASKIYQSSRGSPYDIPIAFLPPAVERIGEVASFEIPTEGQSKPGHITLKDGRVLSDIGRVILATGYHFSHPFLLDLHDDDALPETASETVLVTDGTQIHNLHKDIFYIPDPTLAFVGVPFYTATFTLFEYQAIVVAAVFAGRAWLPNEQEMRDEYSKRVEAKGYGRAFHSLRDQQVDYVTELLAWINEHAEVTGAEKVEGYSEKWLAEDKLKLLKMKKMFEAKDSFSLLVGSMKFRDYTPILIIGAGVFGLNIALHLGQRGYTEVTVIDKQDYGKTLYSYDLDCNAASAVYQNLALEALGVWKQWNKELSEGTDLPIALSRNYAVYVNSGTLNTFTTSELPPSSNSQKTTSQLLAWAPVS